MRSTVLRFESGQKLKRHEAQEVIAVFLRRAETLGFLTGGQALQSETKKPIYDPTDLRDVIRKVKAEARIQKRIESGKPLKPSEPSFYLSIGIHMGCFRIDTKKLGSNARINSGYGPKSPKGYKRTNVPTWDQRVEFNQLLNDVLDGFKVRCSVRSGPYQVRSLDGRIDSWTSEGEGMFRQQEDLVPECDAREICDSDRLEKEFREKRNAENREKRRAQKLLEKAQKEGKNE